MKMSADLIPISIEIATDKLLECLVSNTSTTQKCYRTASLFWYSVRLYANPKSPIQNPK
jgi:hypothetical protein